MSDVSGRLFGAEFGPAGIAASANWVGGALRIRVESRELVITKPSFRASGFNQGQLQITGRSEAGEVVFVVSDETAKQALLRQAPPPCARSLEQAILAPRRAHRRFVLAWVIIGSFACALLLLGLLGLGWASSQLAKRIPKQHEALLGELVLERTRMEKRVFDRGPLVDSVSAVGARLVRDSHYDYRWYVAEDPQLNAFAAPGAVVVVTTGLLDAAESAEELAGVLSHEVAHSELSHVTAGLIKSLGLRSLFGLIFGSLPADASEVFAHFAELKFSRDAEREADREGLKRLQAGHIAGDGMLRIFEKLSKAQGSNGITAPSFLATHPEIDERIAWLRQRLRELPATTYEPIHVDWNEVQRELEALRATPRD